MGNFRGKRTFFLGIAFLIPTSFLLASQYRNPLSQKNQFAWTNAFQSGQCAGISYVYSKLSVGAIFDPSLTPNNISSKEVRSRLRSLLKNGNTKAVVLPGANIEDFTNMYSEVVKDAAITSQEAYSQRFNTPRANAPHKSWCEKLDVVKGSAEELLPIGLLPKDESKSMNGHAVNLFDLELIEGDCESLNFKLLFKVVDPNTAGVTRITCDANSCSSDDPRLMRGESFAIGSLGASKELMKSNRELLADRKQKEGAYSGKREVVSLYEDEQTDIQGSTTPTSDWHRTHYGRSLIDLQRSN